jgi:hypothetical protein
MKSKYSLVALIIFIIILAGSTLYFALDSDNRVASMQTTNSANYQVGNIKEYNNDTYGYKILYPSFFDFDLDNSKPENVYLTSSLCKPDDNICFLSIESINIRVTDNLDGIDYDSEKEFESIYNKIKNPEIGFKQLLIYPYPENFNENEWIKAVRREYPVVHKQSKGGYGYTIFHNNKIFEITFMQGDSTQYHDDYDPVGDEIMRTFRFTK